MARRKRNIPKKSLPSPFMFSLSKLTFSEESQINYLRCPDCFDIYFDYVKPKWLIQKGNDGNIIAKIVTEINTYDSCAGCGAKVPFRFYGVVPMRLYRFKPGVYRAYELDGNVKEIKVDYEFYGRVIRGGGIVFIGGEKPMPAEEVEEITKEMVAGEARDDIPVTAYGHAIADKERKKLVGILGDGKEYNEFYFAAGLMAPFRSAVTINSRVAIAEQEISGDVEIFHRAGAGSAIMSVDVKYYYLKPRKVDDGLWKAIMRKKYTRWCQYRSNDCEWANEMRVWEIRARDGRVEVTVKKVEGVEDEEEEEAF